VHYVHYLKNRERKIDDMGTLSFTTYRISNFAMYTYLEGKYGYYILLDELLLFLAG
jgi:hypothetical protein